MDQLPRLGKRELICLLLFTCNDVVSVGEVSSSSGCLELRYFLVALSLSLPYKYFVCDTTLITHKITQAL